MQKAEYRYYEISQDLPVMALSGKKWEYLFVDVEEILKEVLQMFQKNIFMLNRIYRRK